MVVVLNARHLESVVFTNVPACRLFWLRLRKPCVRIPPGAPKKTPGTVLAPGVCAVLLVPAFVSYVPFVAVNGGKMVVVMQPKFITLSPILPRSVWA